MASDHKPNHPFYASPPDYDLVARGVPGDVEYFSKLAGKAGDVLELACGTGRVTIPMLQAGARVTGLDLEAVMLDSARHRAEKLPEAQRKKLTLVQGDMRGFELGRKFPLIVVPYRAFQHLLTVTDQRACLAACRKHLTPRGRLVIDIFDPNLRMIAAAMQPGLSSPMLRLSENIDPGTGEKVVLYVSRTPGPENQLVYEQWVFERFARDGRSLARHSRDLYLRYSFRYEMEHLFELCGYEIVSLEGDFTGGPFKHGGEQLWTVKAAPAGRPGA
ncbi:MAG: class I SAM-dependent methyltransferase [Planctomycetes bacterium]|nr:class I SAM-dependent methyltransferase [Planctomycetota bacterium]